MTNVPDGPWPMMEGELPWPGSPLPLGARFDGSGTNVALWSDSAEHVTLSVVHDGGVEERLALRERYYNVWHGYVPGHLLAPGSRYGFRIAGPSHPDAGHHFDPSLLLLDPYALAMDPDRDGRLLSVVADTAYDWSGERRPQVSWTDTVVYEMHVRGFTMQHKDIPAELRGTYAGVAHPAALDHLTSLGVTSVELLPVHQYVSEPALTARGLSNYWGYNSIGFFAPHASYASKGTRGEQVREFKDMVKALHGAGLEVILDVVYNHTGEGGVDQPTLCFRGIDNAHYYHRHGAAYADYTGCGNTVNAAHPQVLQVILDSLRYWVQEMHVDGFRFDLAPALARRAGGEVDMAGAFMTAVRQDPVLRNVKLIAEPWDVGWGGYRVGEFSPPWAEWNDRYRDGVRDFWRGASSGVREIAYRVSGSSDIYGTRRPHASVNFVTAHDGFTLRDLVSYERKHNVINGEQGRDGTDDNRSWNGGAEGETADRRIRRLRARQQRNLLVTLLLSTGVPMMTAGDELGRSQLGNNNAYCQDNEISWVDWDLDEEQHALLQFTRRVLRLRQENVALRQKHFFEGRPLEPGGPKDIAWFTSEGREMDEGTWFDPSTRTLGVRVSGQTVRRRGVHGEVLHGSTFLLVLHSGADDRRVVLPPTGTPTPRWHLEIDTADDSARRRNIGVGQRVRVTGRSVLLFRAD